MEAKLKSNCAGKIEDHAHTKLFILLRLFEL